MGKPVIVVTLLLAAISGACHAAKLPNFVFLICDSMDGRVVDPTSSISPSMATPNFDKIAKNGVNFVNNYCPSPQCVPSRAAMFSGRFPHKTKAWSNAQGLCKTWDEANPQLCLDEGDNKYWNTFDYILEQHGYTVNLIGKVDVGAGLGGGFHSNENSSALTAWTRAANITHPQKPDPRDLVHNNEPKPKQGDWKTIEECVEWLRTKAESSQPYFLYCSVGIPHPSYDTNATWLAMVNDSNVNVPKWLPFEDMHPADQYETASKALYYDGLKPFSDENILQVRKAYYAMVSETDAMFGRVLDLVDMSKTNVIFTSDHGEGNMEHRQNWKNSMYDANNRVPLLMSGIGVEKGLLVRNATSNIDLYPTMLKWAGIDLEKGLDGRDLTPFFEEAPSQPLMPDYIVGEYHSNMANTGLFMVKRGNMKLIDFGRTPPYQNYPPQLFDLESDPEELKDIAAAQPAVVKEMQQLLTTGLGEDIQAIDQECKTQDKVRFRKWIALHPDNWPKLLASQAYSGPGPVKWGTPAQVKEVEAWLNSP